MFFLLKLPHLVSNSVLVLSKANFGLEFSYANI